MARVNIEDDLWTSGRLSKLARTARLDEDRALGRLVSVYRLTQRAGIVADTSERICFAVAIAFESDDEADVFLTAMIAAQLAAVLEDGTIHIKGNEKHVDRLERLRSTSSAGGKARQEKKRNDFQAVMAEKPADNQAVGSAPYSLLPTPFSKTESEKDARAPEDLQPVGANHPEVQFFEAKYRELFKGPRLSPVERGWVGEIIRACADAGRPWSDVLDFYARDFDFSGHTVKWLRGNLREVLNKLTSPPKPKAKPEPRGNFPADDSEKRKKAFDKMAAENAARLSDLEKAAPNERSKAALAKVKARLGI